MKQNESKPPGVELPGRLSQDSRPPGAPSAGNGGGASSSSPDRSVAKTLRTVKQLVTGWGLVIGSAVIDAYHSVQNLVIDAHSLTLDSPAGREVIPYNGAKLQPGGKANAAIDLNVIAARLNASQSNGGGAVNSLRELNRLRDSYSLPLKLRLVDTGTPSEKLLEELNRLRADYSSLNLAPVGLNLVLVLDAEGRPARVVLRGPVPPPTSLNGEWPRAEAGVDSNLKLVIINSPKSDEVAQAGVVTALRSGAFLVSVLTPSTSMDFRLRVLLANSHLSVANLAEFRDPVASLGINCPAEEHFTSVAGIADALSELVKIVEPPGDVIVTLGESGQVIYDAKNGVIFHMGLASEARAICRNYLPAARINGIGDAYVANAAAAWVLFPAVGVGVSRTIHAARRAWAELLAGSNPRFIHPNERWFSVRIISTGLRTRKPAAKGIRQNVSWAEQTL